MTSRQGAEALFLFVLNEAAYFTDRRVGYPLLPFVIGARSPVTVATPFLEADSDSQDGARQKAITRAARSPNPTNSRLHIVLMCASPNRRAIGLLRKRNIGPSRHQHGAPPSGTKRPEIVQVDTIANHR